MFGNRDLPFAVPADGHPKYWSIQEITRSSQKSSLPNAARSRENSHRQCTSRRILLSTWATVLGRMPPRT